MLLPKPQGKVKGKGKAEHLYSALHGQDHFKALRHGSQFYLQQGKVNVDLYSAS